RQARRGRQGRPRRRRASSRSPALTRPGRAYRAPPLLNAPGALRLAAIPYVIPAGSGRSLLLGDAGLPCIWLASNAAPLDAVLHCLIRQEHVIQLHADLLAGPWRRA